MQMTYKPVGDVNSKEKGSGIRYNEGKIPYDFLPLKFILDDGGWNSCYLTEPEQILYYLAKWQAGDDVSLIHALDLSTGRNMEGFSGAAQVFKHVTERPVKPYPRWNWLSGMDWSIPFGCAVRHLFAEINGIELDSETKFPHRYHTDCNLIMLFLYAKTYPQGDDRPPKEFL